MADTLTRVALELWFYREVEKISTRRAALQPDDLSVVKTRMPRTEALRLRSRFTAALKAEGLTAADVAQLASDKQVARRFAVALDDVLSQSPGYVPLDLGSEQARPESLNEVIAELSDLGRQGCRPLSPFDPRWSTMHALQEAGDQLRYTHGRDLIDSRSHTPDLPVWADAERAARNDLARAETVVLFDREDRMGLGRLHPWLTEADMAVARRVLLVEGLEPRRPDAVARSVAVLRELRGNGDPFELIQERNGQLSVRLTERDITVRLAEPGIRGNASAEPFIGRAYSDGLVWRFSRTDGRSSGRAVIHTASVEETVLPLRAALGRPLGVQALGGHTDARGNTMIRLSPQLYLRSENASGAARRQLPSFQNAQEAAGYLEAMIGSARANLSAAIDAAAVIAAVREAPEATEADLVLDQAALSPDPSIAELQRDLAQMIQRGGTEADVHQQVTRIVDDVVGTAQPRQTDDGPRWFDPDLVARWNDLAEAPLSVLRTLGAAVRAQKMDSLSVRDMLQGDRRRAVTFCDDLLEFDQGGAVAAEDLPAGSVRRSALETVHRVLTEQGLLGIEAHIDAAGVIRWSAQRLDAAGGLLNGYASGVLGQVFEPDLYGALTTCFAGGDNHLVVPGYRAVVLPQNADDGERTVEERTRLMGYREEMTAAIRQRLAGDVITPNDRQSGSATSLNRVYRELFDVRYPLDHLVRAQAEGQLELAQAVLRTQAGRVRYPEWISDTMYQSWAVERGAGAWLTRSVGWNELEATGYRNRTILSAESDGYFDPMMTTDSAPGVTRFLVAGARVDEQGRIVPGPANARAAVASLPGLEFCHFDAFDRQRMTLMNLLTASKVTQPVMVAQLPLAGWTMEDGMVVSADFAARNIIVETDGSRRALQVGDKISDLHGNKGVVARVVDRWALPEGIDPLADEAVELFAANPELDVVMSPFGALSRFNAGIPREAAQGGIAPLLGAAGLPLPSEAEMGALRMIITNKSVTAGTRIYAEADPELDEFGENRPVPEDDGAPTLPQQPRSMGVTGRRVSGQLAWALQSQRCDAVMAELYRHNVTALEDLREYAGLIGLGLDELGRLSDSRDSSERRIIEVPPQLDSKGRLQRLRTREAFGAAIAGGGGDVLVPFDLDLPTDGDRRGLEATDDGQFRLPVLSAHLRKPVPGSSGKGHEYSGIYERIFMSAAEYRVLSEAGDAEPAALERLRATAQREFSALTSRVVQREFEGRHNIFRDGVMAARQSRSATAVWTADPRLDLDQIGVSATMAHQLRVSDGSYLLTWRDPVLRSAGVRYLRVVVDDDLHGVSINPLLTKPFDGDFDGDSVGVVALPQPAPGEEPQGGQHRAHTQALSRLTVEANLVDRGVMAHSEALGYEVHPLAIHTGSDVAVANPDLIGFLRSANDIDADLMNTVGEGARRRQLLEQGRALVGELSQVIRDSMVGMSVNFGLRYSSAAAHIDSLRHTCIETGAKGSERALAGYVDYLQVPLGLDPASGQDRGTTMPQGGLRKAAQGVNVALVVKKAVGIPGRISQRGVTALRQADIEAALEVTYPCTQSIMQCKHDPASALHKYGVMQTTVRDFWRGYRLLPDAGFAVAVDDKREPLAATREEWVDQALALYQSPQGLNIPDIDPEMLVRVSHALVGEDGYMINAEKLGELEYRASAMRVSSTALDRLSYQPGFAALLAECRAGSRLFEGRQSTFAPSVVRRNLGREDHERTLHALFEGIEDRPGPRDRRYDPAAGPIQKRASVQVLMNGTPPQRNEPLARRDVLAETSPNHKPLAGSRRIVTARPVQGDRSDQRVDHLHRAVPTAFDPDPGPEL